MGSFMSLSVWAFTSGLGLLVCSRLFAYFKLQRDMRRNGCFPPPKYPHKDPLLGLDVFFDDAKARNRGDSASKERERFSNYGKTFEVNSWGNRCIHTMDVANTQAILSQLFDRFGVEPLRLHVGEPFIGKGVFSTDGAYWRQSRELIKPMFARAQVSDFAALDVHLSRMMDRIPTDGSTVDLQGLLKLMFLDRSTELIFGESTETLLAESPDAHSNELLQTFDAALQGLGKRIFLGKIGVLFFWDRSYIHLASRVHTAVDYYIDKAIGRQKEKLEREKQPLDGPKRYIILDELLDTVHDRSDIRNHLLNIFLPGRDATALGLSGLCFLLARHQHVWQKLRAEVLSIKGPLTYDVLKSLKYMKYVLNESLRLLMPSNSNRRLCLKDCVLPTGGGPNGKEPIFVPRGTTVIVNLGAMQRDKDIWGEDAEAFRPERWEGMKTGWHYLPFSGGPRICPGQQLTLTECAYVLARLLQRFESMENRDPELMFVEQSRLTIESRNGVKVAFTPAPTPGLQWVS